MESNQANCWVFLVSKKGIEVDPAKAKAIIDMPPPKKSQELRSLQGRMQSIRRFISNLAMRCEPFNHLLRKGVKFEWGPECQQSFDRIKKYLLNPPILKPSELGKTSFAIHLSQSSRMRRILGAV